MYRFTNILITGGCGFIGSNYINHLLNKYININIINVDRLDYCADINNINIDEKLNKKNNNHYYFYNADICNHDYMNHIIFNHCIDTIVHFAAQTHVDNSFVNSKQFVVDNIIGTQTLLDLSRNNNIKRFLHFSTDEVYGEIELDNPGSLETDNLNPTNPYAASKAGAEYLVKSYYHSFKLPVIISRCNNAFGNNQYPDKLIPKFINKLINNELCTIHGKGLALRSFIHTDNINNAVDCILQRGEINEIYNIGSVNEYNVNDIYTILLNKLKSNEPINSWKTTIDDRCFNDKRYYVNMNKLMRLGWNETNNFNNKLEETIIWYLNKYHKKDAINELKECVNLNEFNIYLNFNSLKLSFKLKANIRHNLCDNYDDLSLQDKFYYIKNNLFLNWFHELMIDL